MTGRRLSRSAGDGRAAAPVRLVHLGLGNFFRAHQAWYTDRAGDAGEWGYAASAGRGSELARLLERQDGLYTLVVRAADGDALEVVSSLSLVRSGSDHTGWLASLASPRVAALTVTVTEAGYCRGSGGGLDAGRPDVAADIGVLRDDPTAPVVTPPARIVAGLAARRRADAGPLAIIPCDNVPRNGEVAGRVVAELAALVDPALAAWITDSVAMVTTVVDRITPRPGPEGAGAALQAIGYRDEAAVVTEPYTEWVLSGSFPAGRPRWEDAGAVFADDVTSYEHRKLWMLNGAHSLLAYAGSLRGHRTVADAVADDSCREWVEEWWTDAVRHLDQPAPVLDGYRAALLGRLANPRLRDQLVRIAEDGSQKLPIRVLPVLRAERHAGRLPTGATRILAAWICHLRGAGAPVHDVRASEVLTAASGPLDRAVPEVLALLDPATGDDPSVVTAVTAQCRELARTDRR